MESAKIENLLEAYFEGTTTLAEEQMLQEYFSGNEVASHLLSYKPLFEGIRTARKESSDKEVELPRTVFFVNPWIYRVAAIVLVVVTVAGVFFSQDGLSAEELQALAAYNEARESLELLSFNLNKGTAGISHLEAFTKGQASIAHINEFTETTNKILK